MKRNYVLIFASAIVFMMSACSKTDRDNGVQEEIGIIEERFEYDENGNLIRSFFGYEETNYEYDSYGNKIHSKSPSCERWSEYDGNGNRTHYKEVWNENSKSEYLERI